MKQRLFFMLLLAVMQNLSVFAGIHDSSLRAYNGQIVEMTLCGEKFAEATHYDGKEYKILTESQREQMLDQEDVADSISVGDVIFVAVAFVLGLVLPIPSILLLVFAVCLLFCYQRVRDYFNRRAGEPILSSTLKLHRREGYAAIVGGIYGMSLWGNALLGLGFGSVVLVVGLVGLGISLKSLYKRCLAITSPRAAKWYIIYCAMLALSCALAGALLSVVAIFVGVASLMGKGINVLWDDEFTHKHPSEDGSASTTRRCSACSDYHNGYCRYHNRPMPSDGGCGVR